MFRPLEPGTTFSCCAIVPGAKKSLLQRKYFSDVPGTIGVEFAVCKAADWSNKFLG